MSKSSPSLSYKDAGVNIDAGNEFVKRIAPLVKATRRPEVLSSLGGFGGLFQLSNHYKEPVLVSGTDGVGTKLKLAQMLAKHDTIGIDLVAMCVNDILVLGAEPLFFLDYFACGKLDVNTASSVVGGIADGCGLAGCSLIGGETAEMPDMYPAGDYDLAGFCVGVCEKSEIIDGSGIAKDQVILGLDSSGPHSNGYSLIRKVLEVSKADIHQSFSNSNLGDTLLAPTRIYVSAVRELLSQFTVHGMAHITGGGLTENIVRVVPDELSIEVDLSTWTMPEVFNWLQQQGNISEKEMLRTFNYGIGYVLIVNPDDAAPICQVLEKHAVGARIIGKVVDNSQDQRIFYVRS